jgi:glycosyltransferase involved in cell wall biosynthesis
MRPQAVQKLLDSVSKQTLKPNEILIIDGSTNNDTSILLAQNSFNLNLNYFIVPSEHRGLTRQRNYGLSKVSEDIDIVAFLDDDLVLELDYFEQIIHTFHNYTDAIGVGGIDLMNNPYLKIESGVTYNSFEYYQLDGWVSKEPLRYKFRKLFGLMSNLQPGLIPEFSHGRSSFPPNGKTYKVEHFMGGIAAYKKDLFSNVQFSSYFEGYGLYEDFDFCVRALHHGILYVNTTAKVWHYHESAGRPNQFKYGKMVIRNGWYVWKKRYPVTSFKARFKWNVTALLLAHLRLMNLITGPNRKDAFKEYLGRFFGFITIIFNKPI